MTQGPQDIARGDGEPLKSRSYLTEAALVRAFVAIARARAELLAVQDAAMKLAVVMSRFGRDAEHIAALLRELDAEKA
jgi:hypothetical protein